MDKREITLTEGEIRDYLRHNLSEGTPIYSVCHQHTPNTRAWYYTYHYVAADLTIIGLTHIIAGAFGIPVYNQCESYCIRHDGDPYDLVHSLSYYAHGLPRAYTGSPEYKAGFTYPHRSL